MNKIYSTRIDQGRSPSHRRKNQVQMFWEVPARDSCERLLALLEVLMGGIHVCELEVGGREGSIGSRRRIDREIDISTSVFISTLVMFIKKPNKIAIQHNPTIQECTCPTSKKECSHPRAREMGFECLLATTGPLRVL